MRQPPVYGARMGVDTAEATEVPQGKITPWDEIRALHVKGMSLRDISTKYGLSYTAIRSRSSREKWCNSVAVARHYVAQGATDSLMRSAGEWVGKIDRTVHAALDNVMQKGLHKLTLRDLSVALDCADKANRIARQTYGLDADGSTHKVQVNVAVLGNATAVASNNDVIDIDSLSAPSLPA